MKNTLAILLITSSFFSYSQIQTYSPSPDYNGPIKSVFTYNYAFQKSDSLANLESLHPTCEVCDHFQKFDDNGVLIESQEYLVIEPVSDLEMGYCLNQIYTYENGVLVLITSKRFEQHGMNIWTDDFADSTSQTTYSIEENDGITTTSYIDDWGGMNKKQYKNGLLIQDKYKIYAYDDKDRLIKSGPLKLDTYPSQRTETWTYTDDLLTKHTSISGGNYFFGTEIHYEYYDSGKLLAEKKYNIDGPEENADLELYSEKFYHEDGRDSTQHYMNLFSNGRGESYYTLEYEFHPNGAVSTKTQLNANGKISGFESHDANGNLTQINSYNTNLEVYNIDRFTYNEKNQLIEKNVVNNYHDKEHSILYTYDTHGNKTHIHKKTDGISVLVQHNVYEYYK